MSAFISNIHYQLYNKIKYQEELGNILLNLFKKEKPEFISVKEDLLPIGELDDVGMATLYCTTF